MKESGSSLKHNPFEKLGKSLKRKTAGKTSSPPPEKKPTPVPEENETAFLKAMQGVTPLSTDRHAPRKNGEAGRQDRAAQSGPAPESPDSSDTSVMNCLANLVETGEGFIVCNTPEYMEGTGRDVPPEFAERLHRGDFSIQAHIDLHGLGVAQAREVFEAFLDRSILSGKRAVLVIHGRGLSSPGEPVLKNKVREWLTRTSWRKWVIAFTSAQSYDGGAGATYILLRSRPRRKKG